MTDPPPRYRSLVSAADSVLIIIDFQSDITGTVERPSHDDIIEVSALLGAAKSFAIPLVATTLKSDQLSGGLHDELAAAVSKTDILERGDVNPWDDNEFRARVQGIGRSRLIVAGQCSELSVTFATLSALEEGYEVYMVTDVSFGASKRHHETAVERMVQAGVVPVTARQVVSEWQRGLTNSPVSAGAGRRTGKQPKKP